MNFEVMCIMDGRGVVSKEYFSRYQDALRFQIEHQDLYDCVSITPMTEVAEHEMACVQCGGRYGKDACKTCRHR